MDISKAKVDSHYYPNTAKKRKSILFILDQKQAKEVRILQEQCAFLYDKDFMNALECNAIEGVDFERRDVRITNAIYGYRKGATDGKFKHSRKDIKMDRTTKNIATMVPPASWNITQKYTWI